MKRRFDIAFVPTEEPVAEPVTKFGGQPVWLEQPEWPISRAAGIPMRFIGQIALDDLKPAPGCAGRMAYLFMTDTDPVDGEIGLVSGQHDPRSGENAVILQPGGDRPVETRPIINGPTLIRGMGRRRRGAVKSGPGEFRVRLTARDDPDFIDLDVLLELDEDAAEDYCDALAGSKLGGTPGFLQEPVFPYGPDRSLLVLQLSQDELPFFVDFGDEGIGFLFVEVPGDQACFLWQGN